MDRQAGTKGNQVVQLPAPGLGKTVRPLVLPMLINHLNQLRQRMCTKSPNKPNCGLEPVVATCMGAPASSGQPWAPPAAQWASVWSGSSWGSSGIRVSSQVASSSLTPAPCFTFSVFSFIPSPFPSWPTDNCISATRSYSQSPSFLSFQISTAAQRVQIKPILLSTALKACPHGTMRADGG